MSLDHGLLNVPLAKRGDIDKQIDSYKSGKAATAKIERGIAVTMRRAMGYEAKQALADLIGVDGLLTEQAARLGTTRAALIDILDGWSKWEPAKIIKARAEWMAKPAEPNF